MEIICPPEGLPDNASIPAPNATGRNIMTSPTWNIVPAWLKDGHLGDMEINAQKKLVKHGHVPEYHVEKNNGAVSKALMLNPISDCVLLEQEMGKTGGIWLNISQTSMGTSYHDCGKYLKTENQKILGRPCSAPEKHIDAIAFIDQGNDSRMVVRFSAVEWKITRQPNYVAWADPQNTDSMISQHSSTLSSQSHGTTQVIFHQI